MATLPPVMKALTAAILLFAGILPSSSAEPLAPDFKLRDVNLKSNRQASTVSPRDYILQVSGYYFGFAG